MQLCDSNGTPASGAPIPARVPGAPASAPPPATAVQGAAFSTPPDGTPQPDVEAASAGQHVGEETAAAAGVTKAGPPPLPAATHHLGALPAAAAEAEAKAAAGAPSAQQEARLRMEYFSNSGARLLSWLVFVASLVLLGATVALVCLK